MLGAHEVPHGLNRRLVGTVAKERDAALVPRGQLTRALAPETVEVELGPGRRDRCGPGDSRLGDSVIPRLSAAHPARFPAAILSWIAPLVTRRLARVTRSLRPAPVREAADALAEAGDSAFELRDLGLQRRDVSTELRLVPLERRRPRKRRTARDHHQHHPDERHRSVHARART